MQEYNSQRQEGEQEEYPVRIDGKEYILRPRKKSSVLVDLLTVDQDDEMKMLAYLRAPLVFLESALSREHPKTRKQAGHGNTSVPGCQACDVYDRLDDDDDPLTMATLQKVASELVGKFQEGRTG